MKSLLYLFALLLTMPLYAQHIPRDFRDYQRNSEKCPMNFGVTNYGMIGRDTNRGDLGLEYPRGSGKKYLFNGGMFVAGSYFNGIDTIKTGVSTCLIRKSYSWMSPYFPAGVADSTKYAKVTFSTDFDASGRSKYATDNNYPVWRTSTEKLGVWVNDESKRTKSPLYIEPAYHSFEDIVCRYDDHDTNLYQFHLPDSPRIPLGVTVEQHIYTFFHGPLESAVIVRCRLKNTSNFDFNTFYFGARCDPDIGESAKNDFLKLYRVDTNLRLQYAWNGWRDYVDPKLTYPTTSGYFGLCVIDYPYIDSNNRYTSNPAKRYRDPFVWSNQYNYRNNDPNFPSCTQEYEIASYYITANNYYNFENADVVASYDISSDLIFRKGDEVDFAYAYLVAEPVLSDTANGSYEDVSKLVDLARRVKLAYASFKESGVPMNVEELGTKSSCDFSVYPVPADESLFIVSASDAAPASFELYDQQGKRMAIMPQHSSLQSIDTSEVPSGMYTLIRKQEGSVSSTQIVVLH